MEIYGVVEVLKNTFLTIALKESKLSASHPDVLTLRKSVSRTDRVQVWMSPEPAWMLQRTAVSHFVRNQTTVIHLLSL